MRQYNFDKIIDRKGTNALRTDDMKPRFGREDLLPLWIADTDFETPDFIREALIKRIEHPIFGYPKNPDEYIPSIISWVKRSHNVDVAPEWLSYIPGIVKGLGMVVNVFTEPGDKVIIQPPVYPPFSMVVKENDRQLAYNPLKFDGKEYTMDFENLEQIIDDKCKMLILANPHNPIGITWKKETLQRLAEICNKHKILVVSDEIHSDLALFGSKHTPFFSVSDAAYNNSITFASPSKTFNIAGIVTSYSITPNETIRNKFHKWLFANEFNNASIFSTVATVAAYMQGEEWVKQMKIYVEENISFVINYVNKNIPKLNVVKPQASFLVWLDCRALALNHEQLLDLFINKAKLAFNDGETFGQGGTGFMRMNIGAPRAMLEKALTQLKSAIENM